MSERTPPLSLSLDRNLLAPDVEAPLSRISDFEVLQKLGSRAGVSSFLATRPGSLGFSKRVMLRVAELPRSESPEVCAQMVHEARVGMHLSHPNLLQTLDLGVDDNRFFLVREWVDGIGLRGLMSRAWAAGLSIPPLVVIRIALSISRVLGYLHAVRDEEWAPRGVVHRAVTPSNILLSYAGEIRLANLCVAHVPGRDSVGPGTSELKLIDAYRAPELDRGGVPTPACDLFSLGTLSVEALVGPETFGGSVESDWERRREDRQFEAALDRLEELYPELHAILSRACATRPGSRQRSAGELRDGLLQVLRDKHSSSGDQELRELLHSTRELSPPGPESSPR